MSAIRRELTRGGHLLLCGLHASARSLTLTDIAHRTARPLFIVMDNEESARYMFGDLKTLTQQVFFFPAAR